MSQVKITSFFAPKNSHPIKLPPVNNVSTLKERCCNGKDALTVVDYDSDNTDIYDYEEDIVALSSSTEIDLNDKDFEENSEQNTNVEEKVIYQEKTQKESNFLRNNVKRRKRKDVQIEREYILNDDSQNSTKDEIIDENMSSLRRSLRFKRKPSFMDTSTDEDNINEKSSTETKRVAIKKKRKLKKMKSKRTKSNIKSFFKPNAKESIKNSDLIVIGDDASPERPQYIPEPLPNCEFLKLWTQTYEPKSTADLISHAEEIDLFKNWLTTWHATFVQANDSDSDNSGNEVEQVKCIDGKCFFIHGPSGVGKTSLVYSIAHDHGYKVLEYNATSQQFTPALIQKELCESLQSHYINQSSISNFFTAKTQQPKHRKAKKLKTMKIKKSSQQDSSVQLSKSLILIDDFDGIIYENRSFSEIWRALKSIIADARKPIVFTSSYDQRFLCSESQYFCSVKLNSIGFKPITDHLSQICIKESLEPDHLSGMKFDGDVRSSLNHAQFWLYGSKSENMIQQKVEEVPNEFTVDDCALYASLLDLLSLEEIFQRKLDIASLDSIELARPYDRYLHDNRPSLLFAYSESTDLHRDITLLSKSLSTLKSPTESQNELICELVRDHYTQPDRQSSAQFADSIAFFDTLSQTSPNLVEELLEKKKNDCRPTRVTKGSLYDYLK